jgi:hypothetical protein
MTILFILNAVRLIGYAGTDGPASQGQLQTENT